MRLTLVLLLSTALFAQTPSPSPSSPRPGSGQREPSGAPRTRTFKPSQADIDVLKAFVKKLEQAWNAGDPNAYVAEFIDDSEYVDRDGNVFQGRARIQEHLQKLLKGAEKGSRVAYELRNAHFVRPKVVLCSVDATLTRSKGSRPMLLRMTYVLSREKAWVFVSGQETQRR